MKGLADYKKVEVAIPAYTCFSVPAAIIRSGIRIRLVDIDPLTMDYNYDELKASDLRNVLAIIGCNLFGILSDWNILVQIARENDLFLIDDAAQSMDSYSQNKASGNLGDAGFYSLGRGKNLSVISGGILVTGNEKIALNVSRNMKELKKNKSIYEIEMLFKIILYALFINPRLYWIPDKLPFLKLGQTIFDADFDMSDLSILQRCAGAAMFPGLKDLNAVRLKNARMIAERILNETQFQVPGFSADESPIYLRLPVLASDRRERDAAINALQQAGIKSSVMYPSTINQIDGIESHLSNPEGEFKGALTVVDRLFTLPTHNYVKDSDIDKIIDCLIAK
jgi:dTDP-4-amino-4,6-dideoxygalactose transaminase